MEENSVQDLTENNQLPSSATDTVSTVIDLTMLANVYGSLENDNFSVNNGEFVAKVKALSGQTSDQEVENIIDGIVTDKIIEGDCFSSKTLANKWKDLVSAAVNNWLGEAKQRDILKDLEFVGPYYNEIENQRKDAFKFIFSVYEKEPEAKMSLRNFFRLIYNEEGVLDVELHRGKNDGAVILSVLEFFFTSIKIRTTNNNLELHKCINSFHEICHSEIIGYPYKTRGYNRLIAIVHEGRDAKNQYHPPKILPEDIFEKLLLALFVLSVLQKERKRMDEMKTNTKKKVMAWYSHHKDCFTLSEKFMETYWENDIKVRECVGLFIGRVLSIEKVDKLWALTKNNDDQGNFIVSNSSSCCADDVRLLMESCLEEVIQEYDAGVDCDNKFEDRLSLLEKMSTHVWNIKNSWVFDTIEDSYTASNNGSCQFEDLINGHLPKYLLLLATVCHALERFKTGIVYYRKSNINHHIRISVNDITSNKERTIQEKSPWYNTIGTSQWRLPKKTEDYREVTVKIENKQISENVKINIDTWTIVALGCESGKKPSISVLEKIKYPGLYFDEDGAYIGPVQTPEQEPGSESNPEPDLEPKSESKPEPELKPAPESMPDPEPKPKPEPEPKQEQKTEPESKVNNVEFVFDGALMVMKCPTSKVEIYYTLDGTEPTTASSRYLSPFRIKPDLWPLRLKQVKTIKAFAVKKGWTASDVTTAAIPVSAPIALWLSALAFAVVLVGACYKGFSRLESLIPDSKAPIEQKVPASPLPSGDLYPILDGKAWIVKEMDGERVATGQVNAEIRTSNTDQTYTECRMAVVGDYESQFRQITFNYDRQTGQLTSPQLGAGRVEIVNKIVRLRITFEGWIIEK